MDDTQLQAPTEVYSPVYLATIPRSKPYEVEPGVRKIAILRSNAIGDFIFALPALEALRYTYPQAEIVLFALDWHADFLRDRPGPIDRVEVIPHMQGLHLFPGQRVDPAKVEAFFKRMQAEDFDLAIQAHGGGRNSNPFVKRLGARLTVGARDTNAPPLDRWIHYNFFQMEVMRLLDVVSLVGAQPVSLKPHLEVTTADLAEADERVPPSDSPLVVIHPGAGDPRRRWPVEKFAFVGDQLANAGIRVVVIGAETECELGAGVVSAMQAEATNLCGQTSLGGLAGLLSRADLVISNDSGPRHLAEAVGTPTIGIYWVGNVITAAPVSQIQHRIAISWRLDCPVCGRNCIHDNCEHRDSFVADVPESEIVRLAFEMLAVERERTK